MAGRRYFGSTTKVIIRKKRITQTQNDKIVAKNNDNKTESESQVKQVAKETIAVQNVNNECIDEFRTNEINVQMLSKNLFQQLFGAESSEAGNNEHVRR